MADIRLLELRNTYKWGGGPDKTILLSAERHDPQRVSVVVAYIRDVRDQTFVITDKARARGLTFYEIAERSKLDLRVLYALRGLVLRYNINLIHSHDYKSDLFAYLLRQWLWRQHLAVLSTMHGWALLGLRGRLYWQLELRLMRRFDHLIAVSHATKDELVTAGVPARLISVIHNAIDTEAWTPSPASPTLRQALGIGPAGPVIGYVGRLTAEKDLETWLHVASAVAEKYQEAHFILLGEGRDGEILGQLKHMADALGIARRVHFLGYLENPRPIYSLCDVFVLSSLREGICNSLLEAMAMGIPVVSTDAGGTRELVIDGQTGFVLPTRDVPGLARAVMTLLDAAPLRARMGQAGRERVECAFSFTHRMQRIEELYAKMLGLVPECQNGVPMCPRA